MAWTDSRVFAAMLTDALAGTAAFDLNSDTLKAALYDNAITPDQTVTSANTAYDVGQWASANEVSDGTNWDAAGEPLTSVTVSHATGVMTMDAADLQQGGASCTLADVHGCLIYDDTLAAPVADQGVCYIYFGGVNGVSSGNFVIQWSGSGIMTLDTTG